MGNTHTPTTEPRSADTVVAWAIPFVFLALAAWFVLGHQEPDIPLTAVNVVPEDSFAPDPWRDPTLLPQYQAGGFEQNCNACHRLFESKTETPANLTQHTDITFDHGMNNRCFNCHDRENRESLVLYTGELIPFHDTVKLCAQCHGPTFRDWERGVHGKTMGHWDQQHGTVTKLTCVQCHDPHGMDIYKPAGGLAFARQDQSCAPCHRDQSRPFVFVHEALREGCSSCHQPHGSVNDKMLIARDNNLCLKCHAQIANPNLGDGNVNIGAVNHTAFLSRGSCWSSGCHTAIHGSNVDPKLRY